MQLPAQHEQQYGEPYLLLLCQIEAIRIHHFHPCSNKVIHKLLFVVVLCVNLGVRTQNGIGTKDQIQTRRRPFNFTRFTIADFIQVFTVWLPRVFHVGQVGEEIIRQRPFTIGKYTVLRAAVVGSQHTQPANQHRHLFRR